MLFLSAYRDIMSQVFLCLNLNGISTCQSILNEESLIRLVSVRNIRTVRLRAFFLLVRVVCVVNAPLNYRCSCLPRWSAYRLPLFESIAVW